MRTRNGGVVMELTLFKLFGPYTIGWAHAWTSKHMRVSNADRDTMCQPAMRGVGGSLFISRS